MQGHDSKLLEDLHRELKRSPFLMLGLQGHPAISEPMTAYFDEESYPQTLYFYTRTDNRLMQAMVQAGPNAVATYMAKDHGLFATLTGRLTACNDRALIDRFWSNGAAAWFEGGRRDPTLQMLQLDLSHAEVWEADVSVAGKLKLRFGGDVDRRDFQGDHGHAVL